MLFLKKSILFAPFRQPLALFDFGRFKTKRSILVSLKSAPLSTVLKTNFLDHGLGHVRLVKKGSSYLLVDKGKVMGYYNPATATPPPLPHTMLLPNSSSVSGGITIREYHDALLALSSAYRSFMLIFCRTGALLAIIDIQGRVPEGCGFLPTFFPAGPNIGWEDWESGERVEGPKKQNTRDSTPFEPRYSSVTRDGAFFPDSTRESGVKMPQLCGHGGDGFYNEILDFISEHYHSDIDQCPTWWRRLHYTSQALTGNPGVMFYRLQMARQNKPETGEKYDFDLYDEPRWTPLPTHFSTKSFIGNENDPEAFNIGRFIESTKRGYFYLDS